MVDAGSGNKPDSDAKDLEARGMGPKLSERHNLVMIYTCNVCQTRSAKSMSRQTYEKGVVIVRCFTCKNLHLIADRLGWFGEPGSVEDFLKEKGIEVRKGSEESYEFSAEDLAGWSPPVAEQSAPVSDRCDNV
jgi:protein import protein ZIM17